MFACRLRDSPSTSSTHNKISRHLEQRRNRKSALGNLYIGGVRAELLRRDTPAVETTRAAAIKGQRHRNPTGLKTALQLLSSPCPNLAGVSFTNPCKSNVLCPRATSLFCRWWRATSRVVWLGVRVLFDHPDIFLCRPGLCVLTGPLFPIGIEHFIYMIFFCYSSSNGY